MRVFLARLHSALFRISLAGGLLLGFFQGKFWAYVVFLACSFMLHQTIVAFFLGFLSHKARTGLHFRVEPWLELLMLILAFALNVLLYQEPLDIPFLRILFLNVCAYCFLQAATNFVRTQKKRRQQNDPH